ncbi:MAG: adenosylcobinamide-GDP ribazoletransferase, partial [Patescibacteria group bacterium]
MKRGDLIRRRLRHIRRLIGYEARLLGTAWAYSTRIPLPPPALKHINRTQHTLEESARYMPLVGLFVGAIAGSVFLGANELFGSKALAIILSIAASIIVTGAFQENGLINFFNRFAGTFGSGALMVAILIKSQALLLIPGHLIPSALIAAHAFSQFAAGSFIFTHGYVGQHDDGHLKPTMN